MVEYGDGMIKAPLIIDNVRRIEAMICETRWLIIDSVLNRDLVSWKQD